MWALNNTTPYQACEAILRDRDGAELLVIVVKGTYRVEEDGSTPLAEEPVEIVRVPVYAGEPSLSSLIYETDFVPCKPTTDVLLLGYACPPEGRSVRQIDVTLRVGPIRKTLRVSGDRQWKRHLFGLRAGRPVPFERMPIVYERAFGGPRPVPDRPPPDRWETRNPVGTGFATRGAAARGTALPNVEYPKQRMKSWRTRRQPAGFGPVARHWLPRLKLAGTYDKKWEEERLPLVPEDFDDRFYQCAPVDQQTPAPLMGGEPVELTHVTPGGRLRFRLPRAYLAVHTKIGGVMHTLRTQLHTVILEPDVPRVVMVWHAALRCSRKVEKLERIHVVEKRRMPLSEIGTSGTAGRRVRSA